MSIIAEKIEQVVSQIKQFCEDSQRKPDDVTLLAVSKTRSTDEIREAFHQGLRCFGENYVQEAVEKIVALADLPIEWHFIGPLQSNKTRQVAEAFSWVHSVDRLKIAKRLSEQRPANLPALNICLQVNIDDEQSKSGCHPDEAIELARQIAELPNLKLRGLMAIPAPTDDPEQQHRAFKAVSQLSEQLRLAGLPLDTLSMGMSSDLEAAIAEGSTMVRVGTALFGSRPAKSVE
ncbi:MAG: YggS family pyridoxal phosphate-dependent enzyme [Oceanospirillales bacterium]|nr:MAG: YggS family pyridoxal phosphate-dependent enzyme [Oceanospirillales bacterium]